MADAKVVVSVRVRSSLGTDHGEEKLQIQTTEDGHLSLIDGRNEPRNFSFNHVFDGDSKQEDVYACVGQPVVDNVIEGFNACVFAYGQTGSGKTYSMIGEEGNEGLIPRISRNLISRIHTLESPSACTFTVSYVEVYLEKLKDLLVTASGKKSAGHVSVREHPKLGTYVDGATQVVITTHEEIMRLIEIGNKSRTTTGTAMNAVSSRSHAIFTIVIEQGAESLPTEASLKQEQSSEVEDIGKVSRLNLIDLAGSESSKTSLAQGQVLKEGASINKSLMTLGRVIKGLAEKKKHKKETRIPYRDSVLTFLLKDSLGGNAKTNMVATIRPEAAFMAETLSTLRYAQIANMVVNKAVINEHPLQKKVKELEAVIASLLAKLNSQDQIISIDDMESLKLITDLGLSQKSLSPKSSSVLRRSESEKVSEKNPPEDTPGTFRRGESERVTLRRELAQTKEELELERAMTLKERKDNMMLREELRRHEEREHIKDQELNKRELLRKQHESIEMDQSHGTMYADLNRSNMSDIKNEADSDVERHALSETPSPSISGLLSDENSQKLQSENESIPDIKPPMLKESSTSGLLATISENIPPVPPEIEGHFSPTTTMKIMKAGSEAVGSEYHLTRIRNLKKNITGLRVQLDKKVHLKRASRFKDVAPSPSTAPHVANFEGEMTGEQICKPTSAHEILQNTEQKPRNFSIEATKALLDQKERTERQIKESMERAKGMRDENRRIRMSHGRLHNRLKSPLLKKISASATRDDVEDETDGVHRNSE